MIKVNLLRGLGAAGGGVVDLSGVSAGAPANVQNQAALRILAILSLPLMLYIYDWQANSDVTRQLAEVRRNLAAAETEKAKFGDTGMKLENLGKDKKALDEKIGAVREIARNRLREVKSLDALQSLLPAKTWLDKVQMQNGLIRVVGYTGSDEGITDLIRGLESSMYFSRVDPKSTSQEKLGKATVKKFELEFHVGKVPE